MAKAEHREVASVSKEKLWKVICDFEKYPKFVENCTGVKIESREQKTNETVVALYKVSLMKDMEYRLTHTLKTESGQMDWKLIDSDLFKLNQGSWKLKELGPEKTEIHYSIEMEFKIPVPGFILNRLVKGNLPAMIKSFVDQAK